MKRLIAVTIALSLLGSSAAMADGWHGRYDGRYEHRGHGDAGAAIALGLGVAALAAIASQHYDHDGYYGHRARYYGSNGYYYGGTGYGYARNPRAYYGGYYDRGYYGQVPYGDRYSYGDDDDD